MKSQFTIAALLCVTVCSITGCAKRKPTTSPANSAALMETDLQRSVDDLVGRAAQLPGKTADDHRRQMELVFDDLAEALPTLAGPDAGGAFRVELRTIESSRSALAHGLSASAAADNGLHAVHRALSAIAREPFYSRVMLSDDLDRLGSKLDELDAIRGPFNRLSSADAVRLIASITRRLANVYSERAPSP